MSKLTLERKIASVASQMDGWGYIYDDYRTINERLDNAELPCIVFSVPVTGSLYVGMSQYRDSAECNIAFAMTCELDHDGILTDTDVIEQCKRAAIAFIALCNQSGLFEQISGAQQYDVFVNSYDANVAGVIIHPTITELQGISNCVTASDILNG